MKIRLFIYCANPVAVANLIAKHTVQQLQQLFNCCDELGISVFSRGFRQHLYKGTSEVSSADSNTPLSQKGEPGGLASFIVYN